MEKNDIILQLPLCTNNNLLCARLTTSAVCSLLNIGIDETEDIKVCVNEACLMMMSANYKRVKLVFNGQNDLVITVTGEGSCEKNKVFDDKSKDLGLTLLNSLIDDVKYIKSQGLITSITLTKRIKQR